jgi:hypothetical protein
LVENFLDVAGDLAGQEGLGRVLPELAKVGLPFGIGVAFLRQQRPLEFPSLLIGWRAPSVLFDWSVGFCFNDRETTVEIR